MDMMVLIPGILNFLCWTIHLSATKRLSFIKFIFFTALSICPVVNILSLFAFLLCAVLRAIGTPEFFEGSDLNSPFGFSVEYDETTLSGKLIKLLSKDR